MYYVGDPVPYFEAAASNNPKFKFHSVAGRYIVMSFLGSLQNDTSYNIYNNIISECRNFFDDEKVTYFAVTINPEDEASGRIKQIIPGMRYFKDYDQNISKTYGSVHPEKKGYRIFSLVLDPNLHVRHIVASVDAQQHGSQLKQYLSDLPEIDLFAGRPLTAPILMIPNVFEPEFCKHLIELYKNNGGIPSGFMQEKDGFTVYAQDNSFKKRSDYTIEDMKTKAHMRAAIQRRIVPEIRKAHHFEVSRIERYIVACYDATNGGGFFRAHRDNTTPATIHRRFACTINLNSEDYEGGGLRFPEFGTQSYKPPTGGALIFSCSLLHEALPVTSGTRYCTLPFFFDETAEAIRQKNLHLLKQDILETIS